MIYKKKRKIKPTKLSIKIAKRLIEEVGIKLDLIPENYIIFRDQTAIGINTAGGCDYPTWCLGENIGFNQYLPTVRIEGKEFEINSSIPATKIAKAKKIEIVRTYNRINLYDD